MENKNITVLGKTFATDNERREYFRAELRKQLPELKKIDGYPIGTDDDIVNLSDPPYYTACPNPWLNEFIAEWEEEKKQIENSNFFNNTEVTEPFAADVSEGKNNPIYNAHSYHTKVPHPAIMRYILHYTKPGDIVLDGFAGTGMTGVAAQLCGNPDNETKHKIEAEWKKAGKGKPVWGTRKAILGDLSPIASFIAYNYNTPVDVQQFEKEAKRILAEVENECGWMYETQHNPNQKGKINYTVWSDVFTCPNCNGEMVFWEVAVDREAGKVKDVFNCPHCQQELTKKKVEKTWTTIYDIALKKTIRQTKRVPVLIYYSVGTKRYEKKPDQKDLDLIENIEKLDIPYWFPTDLMMGKGENWGDTWRAGVHAGYTNIHHFYTKRNLLTISKLYDLSKFNNSYRVVINSFAHTLCSKLVRYNLGNRGNGNLNGTLYVGSLIAEPDVCKIFKGKISDFIKVFSNNEHNCIFTNSATQLLKNSKNSIDYIFTDPPFGDNIMYSELSFLWEAWLKVKTNNIKEAIQNKTQNKGFVEYQNLMKEAFAEYFRVLKPGKWMTVEFSNTSASIWNAIQLAIQQAGFVVAHVAALDKQQGSFKAVTTTTAVKQDLIISCYKPSENLQMSFAQNQDSEKTVWEFVTEHLQHLPVYIADNVSSTAVVERQPKILYDRMLAYYLNRSLPIPIDAGDFQAGLANRFAERDGMYFTHEQVLQYDAKKMQNPQPMQLSLDISTETDGILWLKNKLKDKPQKYQDLNPEWMKNIRQDQIRKGDMLPELKTILEENFLADAAERWYIPDPEKQSDMEKLRSRRLIKEFETYISTLSKAGAKKLTQVRVEALRAGFKNCYTLKNWETIIKVGDKIPKNLLEEDEQLLQYYEIAVDKV